MKKILTLLLILGLVSCHSKKKKDEVAVPKAENNLPANNENSLPVSETKKTKISHAEGFNITNYGNYQLLEIKNADPNQTKTSRYALVTLKQAMVSTFNKTDYDGIIIIPIERIAVYDESHIKILNALKVDHSLVEDYATKNFEALLQNNPNLIVSSGKLGKDKTLEKLRNENIPVIYTSDWNEKSDLAKAEWIKVYGALYNKEDEAEKLFKQQVASQK